VIALTHLDGHQIVLNADLVERLEAIPDTVITLTSGKRVLVRDTVDSIIKKVTAYKHQSQPQGCARQEEFDSGRV